MIFPFHNDCKMWVRGDLDVKNAGFVLNRLTLCPRWPDSLFLHLMTEIIATDKADRGK